MNCYRHRSTGMPSNVVKAVKHQLTVTRRAERFANEIQSTTSVGNAQDLASYVHKMRALIHAAEHCEKNMQGLEAEPNSKAESFIAKNLGQMCPRRYAAFKVAYTAVAINRESIEKWKGVDEHSATAREFLIEKISDFLASCENKFKKAGSHVESFLVSTQKFTRTWQG